MVQTPASPHPLLRFHRIGRARRAAVLLSIAALLLTGAPLAAAGSPARPAVAGSTGVFAIDLDHHTVVFIPAAGGTPRPVTSGLTSPTEIAASRAGSVFIVDGTRLLKVNPYGAVLTIRTGMTPGADIAVDDNNWLFVRDGSSIVKYSPVTGAAAISVGTGDPYATMTVDALGNASLTGGDPSQEYGTRITTYPVRGGEPKVRTLVSGDDRGEDFRGQADVVEARDGTIYLQSDISGGSGAREVYRVPPGPAGDAPAYPSFLDYAEYAYNVDSNSRFYLLQNRYWCADPGRADGCVDDYGVDFVQRFTPGRRRTDENTRTGVDLPVGGISVASSGTIYAAVLISRSAGPDNSTAIPQMLRISPTGGRAVVLAKGHFATPVAENFRWYAG